MSREPLLYLEDIADACRRIRRYTEGVSYDDLVTETMRFDAVIRNMEIIGEAVGRLPDDVRNEMSQIPWQDIRAMRNILAHAYFGVDPQIVWDVVSNHVEPLLNAVQQYIDLHRKP